MIEYEVFRLDTLKRCIGLLVPPYHKTKWYGGLFMDFLKILYTSVGSIVALFLLTKIMGARQIAQMSMFDYVNGITIGSIAAEMATAIDDDYREPLIAMVVYAIAAVIFSKATDKSIVLRRVLIGKPVVLFDQGKLFYKRLKKAKMDLGEFMTQLRTSGYFDLSKIETVVLEPSGKLSVLPVSDQRPLTPSDMKLKVSQEKLVANVIIDGHMMPENLKYIGKDENWMMNRLKKHGYSQTKDIFLATCTSDLKINIYKKIKDDVEQDILE